MHEPCSGVADGYNYEDPLTHLESHYPQVWMARHAKPLIQHLGKYSLAALSSEIIAQYRDDRLAGLDRKDARGQPDPRPRSPNTVRLDLALLGHMFNIAIKEWGIGLNFYS